MVTRRLEGGRGFTLIELTIAMLLLAIGLLALVGALGRALQETQRARSAHTALRHLESVADSLAFHAGSLPGATLRPAVALEWRPESCAAFECMRVSAVPEASAADTFTVLVAVARPYPE